MNRILLCTFILISSLVKAQELNYGITFGGNLYDIYSNSALFNESGTKKIGLYIGGYADYGFNKNSGTKINVAYNQKSLGGDQIVDFSFIDISPSYKYSFKGDYNSGFYMLLGPRYSILLSAEYNGNDVKEGFESSNFGLQLGFGGTIYEFIELEFRLDYGLTGLYDIDGKDRKIIGGILALNFNLQKLLNKNVL